MGSTPPEPVVAALPGDLAGVVAALGGPAGETATRGLAELLLPGRLQAQEAIIGLCWATVDLERTVDDVPLPFVPAARDPFLGGTAVGAHIGSVALLVEEPSTEGKLAAFLARNGEGLCAVYVERGLRLDAPRPRLMATSLERPGYLLASEWPWGPFVIALVPGR